MIHCIIWRNSSELYFTIVWHLRSTPPVSICFARKWHKTPCFSHSYFYISSPQHRSPIHSSHRSHSPPLICLPAPPLHPPTQSTATTPPAPRRARTNVSTCRLTLNEIRKFPSYRLIQPFLEDKLPKSPSTPPFAVHHVNSDCVIRIASSDAEIEDRFSWEMVRSVATDIVEDCAWGGVAGIGKGGAWTVAVLGTGPAEGTWVLGKNGTRGDKGLV